MMSRIFLLIFSLISINIEAQITSQKNLEVLKTKEKQLRATIQIYNDSLKNVVNEINKVNNRIYSDTQRIQNEFKAMIIPPCTLRTTVDPYSSVLNIFSTTDTVFVKSFSERHYWYVRYNNTYGYLPEWALVKNEYTERAIKALEKQAQDKETAEIKAAEEASKKRFQKLTLKYGKATMNKVLSGYIWIGMTDELATESIGDPDKVNRTVGEWGVHEQWVYRSKELYLYFENGKLTSYQD